MGQTVKKFISCKRTASAPTKGERLGWVHESSYVAVPLREAISSEPVVKVVAYSNSAKLVP